MAAQNGKPGDIELTHDSSGRLVLVDASGRQHVGVVPVRCFPISAPDRWISLCDSEAHELVVIEDMGSLSSEGREALERDLSRREFVPHIVRILSVPADSEPTEWEVETDRGPTHFVLNSGDDVRRLSAHRALVIDAQGIRYLIDDSRQLDAASRRILERYL
jgi:hypothetical protein